MKLPAPEQRPPEWFLTESRAQGGHLLRNVVIFARLLRSLGLDVTPPQILDFAQSLDHIDIHRRRDFWSAGRTVLVSRPEQLWLYDQAFDLFWQAARQDLAPTFGLGKPKTGQQPPSDKEVVIEKSAAKDPGPESEASGSETAEVLTYSALEILRHKDFAKLTPEELVEVNRLLRAMDWRLEQRRTRRKTRAPHGQRLDMRRTLRRNLGYGGEPLKLAWQRPKQKPRPLVVICDVSGSMEAYARLLLKFVYVISNCLDRVEAFVFGTRLTRITRQLGCGNVDLALDQALDSIQDWGGGTRLGDALKTFTYDWGRRVLGQGAIVLLVSDGLDRGDLDLLEREMDRLQRSCRRLIWLNPLLGSRDYRPIARGMKAALPYVDDFLPVHNLASMEQLGRILERLSSGQGLTYSRGLAQERP